VRRLRDVGEHGWIARLVPRLAAGSGVLVGAGDDASVVRPGRGRLLLTTDALVEGVHFRAGWASPSALGRRLFAAATSDVAAMGGVPRWALLALEAPASTPAATLDGVVAGFAAAARRAGASLVGGNLAAGRHLALTATIVGEAAGRFVTRAGARPGDLLCVTGTLGGAGLAVRALRNGRRVRLPVPPLRVRAGVVLARVASAMIDVSDGLVQDLGHLCRASGMGAELDLLRVPVAPACRRALGPAAAAFAVRAGEDYELLAAVPRAREPALSRRLARLGCRLTRIGRVVEGRARVRVVGPGGEPLALGRGGFDHFRP
jgi:thiamine-monophosphate kinase